MAPIKLNYREYGDGAPLVILHGLFGSARNWHSVAEQLADNHWVICVDLRNHGNSPHGPGTDYQVMASDLKQLLAVLDIDQTSILGHSMGGKTAMWFALTQPRHVENLIVVDIAPVTYSDHCSDHLAAMQCLRLDGLPNRRAAEQQLANTVTDPVIRQCLLQNLTRQDGMLRWRINLDAIQLGIPAIVAFPPSTALFSEPCRFIRGGKSTNVTTEHHTAIGRLFPNASITTVDNAGHWPHIERPAEFLAATADFLDLR